jgi:hypothetical protein
MVKATSMVGKNRKSRLDLPFTESFVNYLNDECRICKLASTIDRLLSFLFITTNTGSATYWTLINIPVRMNEDCQDDENR